MRQFFFQQLVIHENVTKARKDDIYYMLLDIDRIFGITYQIISKLITLYGPINGTNGVIFPVSNNTNYQ